MRRIQQYIQFERVLLRTDLILLFNLITFSFFTPVYWLGERVRRSEPIRHWLSMYVTVDKYTHHTTSPAVARNTIKHLSMPFFNFGLMACSSEKRLIHWWEDGNRVADEKYNIEGTFSVFFFFISIRRNFYDIEGWAWVCLFLCYMNFFERTTDTWKEFEYNL